MPIKRWMKLPQGSVYNRQYFFQALIWEKIPKPNNESQGNDICLSASWDNISPNLWFSWYHVFNSMQSFKVSNKKQHPFSDPWTKTYLKSWSSLSCVILCPAYSFFGIVIFIISSAYPSSDINAEDFFFLLVCLPNGTYLSTWL